MCTAEGGFSLREAAFFVIKFCVLVLYWLDLRMPNMILYAPLHKTVDIIVFCFHRDDCILGIKRGAFVWP